MIVYSLSEEKEIKVLELNNKNALLNKIFIVNPEENFVLFEV